MASPTFTSNYGGDALDYIVKATVLGNEAVSKGSVYVIEDVQKSISIAKMVSTADPIIPREAMPTTNSATVTWSEAQLTPVDMMIYINNINPRIFEAAWRQFQPKGNLPDKVLDPNIQAAFVDVVLRQAQLQMGKLMWQGDVSLAVTNPLHFFDGYVTRAAASSTNIDTTNIGTITKDNIITIFEDMSADVPDALFDDPDMIIHMNTGDFRKYQEADRALSFKGSGPQAAAPPNFGGREIRHYSGLPANNIIIAKSTTGTDSNFYAGTQKASDQDQLIVEKLRPEGEHYFLKALFTMDANFSIDSESVFYAGS